MSTGGAYLSAFNDFMSETGPLTLTGPTEFINEAAKRNYTLSRFLAGRDLKEMVQGGSKIQDFIMRDDASTFTFYKPNATHVWQNPQVMQPWEIHWRFGLDHMAWTEQEVMLQGGDMSRMTREARFDVYKSVARKIEARMWTSMMNGMEDALWAQPDKTEMEVQNGETPYSIPCFLNEFSNGLWTDGGSGAWTTVQSLDPTTETYWVPRRVPYDYADYLDLNNQNDGLIANFHKTIALMRFSLPPMGTEHFKIEQMRMFIACSLAGKLLYIDAQRKSGDRGYVSNPQDASYSRPVFEGFDIQEFENLETAQLYTGGSGMTTEASATADGPRYYFINTNYLSMVFHSQNYFNKRKVREAEGQVGSYYQPTTVWYNLCCRSRRRGLGIMYPAA